MWLPGLQLTTKAMVWKINTPHHERCFITMPRIAAGQCSPQRERKYKELSAVLKRTGVTRENTPSETWFFICTVRGLDWVGSGDYGKGSRAWTHLGVTAASSTGLTVQPYIRTYLSGRLSLAVKWREWPQMIELSGRLNQVMRAQPLAQWPPLIPAPSLELGVHVLTLFFWGFGVFFFFWSMLHSMWNLSSLSRDWIHAPCSQSVES